MNIRQPKIRRKSSGAWYIRWGGTDHYLAPDEPTAQRLFSDPKSTHPGSLARWREWARARRQGSGIPGVPNPAHAGLHRPLLIDAAKAMFRDYLHRDRDHAARYFRTHLARFMRIHGEADLVELASANPKKGRYTAPITALLNAYIADAKAAPASIRLKNRTINHEATCVKRLFNWSAQNGLCPAVVWTGITRLPTRRGTPEVFPIDELAAMILTAGTADPDLVPWLAVTYLCCLRTSETPTLISGNGEWLSVRDQRGKPAFPSPLGRTKPSAANGTVSTSAPAKAGVTGGVFRLGSHKGSWRGEEYERLVVVTPEAASWLAMARRAWKRPDTWSHAAVAAGVQGGPHILRDSAASHLLARGAALADVSILLGHLPPGEWKSYAQVPWPDLHRLLSRITLRSTRAACDVDPAVWRARLADLGPSLAPRFRLQALRESEPSTKKTKKRRRS